MLFLSTEVKDSISNQLLSQTSIMTEVIISALEGQYSETNDVPINTKLVQPEL